MPNSSSGGLGCDFSDLKWHFCAILIILSNQSDIFSMITKGSKPNLRLRGEYFFSMTQVEPFARSTLYFSDLSFTLNSSSTLLSVDPDKAVCLGVKFLFERNNDALKEDSVSFRT